MTKIHFAEIAVYFGYQISPIGGVNKRKLTQRMPISPMGYATYLLSHHMLSEWCPVHPMGEMSSAGDSLKQLA